MNVLPGICAVVFLLLVVPPSFAQISFERSEELIETRDFRSGVPVAMGDLNSNLLDDVIRLDRARRLYVDFQMSSGRFKNVVSNLHHDNEFQWNLCSGDLNNSGLADIVASGVFNGIQVFRQTSEGIFEVENLEGITGFYSQAANLIDIDNDGFLDFFVCDDDGENKIFGNDGSGGFVPRDEWIDMSTQPPSDNSGNYGSVWSDVSGNGKMDLYLSKCRSGVQDETDPRRVNALFVNTGNGEFEESAADFGIADGGQSWASDFADINNNGRMDLFVINHDRESILYINEGHGQFSPAPLNGEIPDLGSAGLQLQFADFDNDGFVDLIVAGSRSFLFHNRGDGTFSVIEDAFDIHDIYSLAVGDLNDDGFLDIYASYGSGLNNPGDIDDAVWINRGNDYRFLRFRMRGTTSNRDGVGAIVKVYSELGTQVREVRAGESYGIQRSNILHFGMAEVERADSVVIQWPSGQVDKYTDVITDEKYLITEGICLRSPLEIIRGGSLLLCENPAIELSAPAGDYTHLWNNGSTEPQIVVTEPGSYHLQLMEDDGCITPVNPLYIREEGDFTPVFEGSAGDLSFCYGDTLELSVRSEAPEEDLMWSNGEQGSHISIAQPGAYFVEVVNQCGVYRSDTILAVRHRAEPPDIELDWVTEDSSFVVIGNGSVLNWFAHPDQSQPDHIGESWEVDLSPGPNTFYASETAFFDGAVHRVGSEQFEGSSKYHASHINGGLIFDIMRDVWLRSLLLYSDYDGPRVIEVFSLEGDLIGRDTVLLENAASGQRVFLDIFLPEGRSHRITTNADFNEQSTGVRSPRLFRSNENTEFPYVLDGKISINTSDIGPGFYYYFYDWEIQDEGLYCESEKVVVSVYYDTTTTATADVLPEAETGKFSLYPNPASRFVDLYNNSQCDDLSDFILTDLSGRWMPARVHHRGDGKYRLNLEKLPAGFYLLSANACGQRLNFNFIKGP